MEDLIHPSRREELFDVKDSYGSNGSGGASASQRSGEEVIEGSSTASSSGTRRTAAELSSNGVDSELVEQCVHCSLLVRCRDINDLGQHYMSQHRAELHLRDFDAAVAKAISGLKARRTPLFVRTQLERTMARSSRTTTAPNQRYRPVRKGAKLE
ncbi:unnamed protein product [Jaminaea pallidilutea]